MIYGYARVSTDAHIPYRLLGAQPLEAEIGDDAYDDLLNELRDLDDDGVPEGLAYDTSFLGFAGLDPKYSPDFAQVWEFHGGAFRKADSRFARFHWRHLMELRRDLERRIARDVDLAVRKGELVPEPQNRLPGTLAQVAAGRVVQDDRWQLKT